MTLGKTIRGKRNHCNQIVCSGGGGCAVGPAGCGLMIPPLDQYLRSDAMHAVEQRVKRAQMQRGLQRATYAALAFPVSISVNAEA